MKRTVSHVAVANLEEGLYSMNFQTKIKELSDLYLANARTPDISSFVDQLFHVAAEAGPVACVLEGERSLRFYVQQQPMHVRAGGSSPVQSQASCIVEHAAAKPVLRMICARLGMVCKERTTADISPYGDKAVIEYDIRKHSHWNVSFTNTAEHQEFVIAAL